MMSASEREKIFKSWSGISEVALIKEVATKGENVDLCIQYWARKRKMPIAEYELFFHDVVQTYVQRLLTERLVCKAETVLNNVERDVRYFYYQFACECNDAELSEIVLDHLKKKESCNYIKLIENLEYHWHLLLQLKESDRLMANTKKYMRRINLETLIALDKNTLQRLQVELYFETQRPQLLENIDKCIFWNYLVDMKQISEIIRWCLLQNSSKSFYSIPPNTKLEMKYAEWTLQPEMFDYGLSCLKDINDDVLRDCFAAAGYIFPDEISNVEIILQRICRTQSFKQNDNCCEKLQLGRLIWQKKYYYLLLQEFIKQNELKDLTVVNNNPLMEFIISLKTYSLKEADEFKKQQPLIAVFELLNETPDITKLEKFLEENFFPSLKYLKFHYQQEDENSIVKTLPTPYDLLKVYKGLDCNNIFNKNRINLMNTSSNESYLQQQSRLQLTYIHYIKQSRSAYAVYRFIIDHLQNYAQISKSQFFMACECIYKIALQSSTLEDNDLIIHCIAFVEMLGFDTQELRCLFKLMRSLKEKNQGDSHSTFHLSLMHQAEDNVLRILEEENVFPLDDFKAIMTIEMGQLFEQVDETSPHLSLVLKRYANANQYWQLLVLLDYFDIPLDYLKQLVKCFGYEEMGKHLLRALSQKKSFSKERDSLKRRSSITTRRHIKQRKKRKDKPQHPTTSVETITSSVTSCNELSTTITSQMQASTFNNTCVLSECTTDAPDIFAHILLNTNTAITDETIIDADLSHFLQCMQNSRAEKLTNSTMINFLHCAIEYRLPVLAVLAASLDTKMCANFNWCWLVWVSVTTGQWLNLVDILTNNVQYFPWNFFELLIQQRQIQALLYSFRIFYTENPLKHLFNFLELTAIKNEFDEAAVHELRLYCLALSNNEIKAPLCPWARRDKLMVRSVRLLLLHLQYNFDSAKEQKNFLNCVCRSGLSDITGQLDFCFLKDFCEILQTSTIRFNLNFIELLHEDRIKEYERVLSKVLEAKEYDVAVRLALLLQKPISDIIYNKWITALELQLEASPNLSNFENFNLKFDQYEQEIITYSLPPETLVNFLLFASSRLPEIGASRTCYLLLQKALNVIKYHHLFPNESFDRDNIEYDMIVAYLLFNDENEEKTLPLYHSEYYEQIMLQERCVLYKSFLELKELAGIEDLNIGKRRVLNEVQRKRLENLLHRLLDEGDIVEALRLQELFEVRPLDLRFIVFCMALAEGLSNVYIMSADERQLFGEIEKTAFSKFNKRTLCTTHGHMSDSASTLEFEEIPSKEKQETLALLQGMASKLQHGENLAKRIICAYRAAMYLDKEYIDILRTKDVQILLRSVAEEDCLHRLMIVSDILTSTAMNSQDIAELLAFEITTAVVRPRFYIFSPDQQAKTSFRNADLWGYNIDRDLHLFLELTPDRTKLGVCLLEYCDALKIYRKYQDNRPYESNLYFERLAEMIRRHGLPSNNNTMPMEVITMITNQNTPPQVLSHKKQNIIYVELLIKAHQCFVHECSMEGIANVLSRAKTLNSILAKAKSWSLIVRLLTGIARYREMYFCFDTLIENEQFESLLGQFDEHKSVGLRQAILAYLREYCPPKQCKELFKLSALHFLMYKDLAEFWEQDAQTLLTQIYTTAQVPEVSTTEVTKLYVSSDILTQLNQSLEYYVHATENYLLDNKLLLAQKSSSQAELTAMQIDLVNKALEQPSSGNRVTCVCVIRLKSREHFKDLICHELSVPQSLIISRAFGYEINWAEGLLSQFIIQMKHSYLNEFLQYVEISDDVIENVVKGFQVYSQSNKIIRNMEEHLAELIDLVTSVTVKYKLASVISLKSTVMALINDQTIHYLRDMNFSRRDDNRNA
uniref:Spatacsin_C domain-containing protein n=1 Tax=Glossina brevipalpis TaxID=37001 RepID=A0A1A9W2C1_9MUSC